MKCRQAKKMLSPYIDDELSDAERAALEEHLGSCEACRSELEALKKISESLRGIYREVKAPPDFLDKVMKRIQELEEKGSSRLIGDSLPWYQGWWLKAAVVAALAAGVGLGALQYTRTHTGTAPWIAYQPGTKVTAEKDETELPTTQASQVGTIQAPDRGTQSEMAEHPYSEGGTAGRLEKREILKARVPAAEEKPANAVPNQGPKEEVKTGGQLVASQDTGTYEPKVFLSKSRHVRVTWVKVEVDDLVAAKIGVAAAAARVGANRLNELWSYQDKETILKVILPSAAAEEFFDRVAALGKVLERKQEVEDITGQFNNKLLEYQVLAAKKDEESQAMARALERHLEELDAETLEAGREVANVCFKLR